MSTPTFPTVDSDGNALVPSSRSYESGDFPVKTYKAQNGSEVRILYGSNRTNMRLSLTYANIKDADAEQFLDHYIAVQGTFKTFVLGRFSDSQGSARGGWDGRRDSLGAETSGNAYRYEKAPQLAQVRPGISTVTVNLIGVL
jgi:hypothetical protein